MDIVNLNQICKIVYVERKQSDNVNVVEEAANITQWFKNLFRKNKIRERYFVYKWDYPKVYYPMDKLDDFIKEHYYYTYNANVGKFYEKPHIVLCYSDYNNGKEIRYFNTDKEAKEYFDKLVAYAKQNDVPFINFYSEK